MNVKMVTQNDRQSPSEMNVITKAKDLCKHSRNLLRNEKHYPKRERFQLVADIYQCSMTIVMKLIAANDMLLTVEEQKHLRLLYQQEALTACKQLLFLIEISFDDKYISSDTCIYWSKMVIDVRNMTAAWHRKDLSR